MVESSNYLRDLSKNEIAGLQTKYDIHMKRTKSGFLERPVKEKLLRKKRWSEYTQDDEVYDFFYKIREHAKTALGDLMLLCDVLTDSQLREIFEFKTEGELKKQLSITKFGSEYGKLLSFAPSLENFLNSLTVSHDTKPVSPKVWDNRTLEVQPDSWKFYLVEHLIEISFEFLKQNGFITSKAHQRLVEEVMDMIISESRNTLIPKAFRKVDIF